MFPNVPKIDAFPLRWPKFARLPSPTFDHISEMPVEALENTSISKGEKFKDPFADFKAQGNLQVK
jgi:hypothetical protein